MIIQGYIRMDGKKPLEKAENRIIYQNPPQGDYAAQYDDGIVQVDIDDYDHQTAAIEEPVHGKPRSDAVLAILDHYKLNFNCVETDHGRHFVFRKPSDFSIQKNHINWYCPLGVKIEVKVNDHREIMRIRGKERVFIRGGFDNDDLDQLPAFLWPIQNKRDKPFSMVFNAGVYIVISQYLIEYQYNDRSKSLNASPQQWGFSVGSPFFSFITVAVVFR